MEILNHRHQFNALPTFDINRSFHFIKNGENSPLVICFQGFYEGHITPYFQQDPNLENLHLANQTTLPFAFNSFAKQHPEFNYLLVKDNYQSWYLLHFEFYLSVILQILPQCNPSKIITAGSSAGAFAAILFGHYLNAEKTFAFAPQTRAYFQHHINAYRQLLNERYHLNSLNLANLPLIQQENKGFTNKIDLYLTNQHPADLIELERLKWQQYGDISVHLLAGNNHDIFSVVDKQLIFDIMRATILRL